MKTIWENGKKDNIFWIAFGSGFKVFSDLIKRKDMLIVASARLPKYVRLYVVFKFPIHLSKSSKLGIQNISFRGNNSYLLREKYLFWINFKKRTVYLVLYMWSVPEVCDNIYHRTNGTVVISTGDLLLDSRLKITICKSGFKKFTRKM